MSEEMESHSDQPSDRRWYLMMMMLENDIESEDDNTY